MRFQVILYRPNRFLQNRARIPKSHDLVPESHFSPCAAGEVVEQYEQLTGSTVRDLPFYYVYAGLRQAVILSRITRRRIHFGEQEPPAHPDEYVLHHAMLARLIAD